MCAYDLFVSTLFSVILFVWKGDNRFELFHFENCVWICDNLSWYNFWNVFYYPIELFLPFILVGKKVNWKKLLTMLDQPFAFFLFIQVRINNNLVLIILNYRQLYFKFNGMRLYSMVWRRLFTSFQWLVHVLLAVGKMIFTVLKRMNNKTAIGIYFAIFHENQHKFATRNRLSIFFRTLLNEAWAEARITLPLDRITCWNHKCFSHSKTITCY